MNSIFEAKLEYPVGASRPDDYHFGSGSVPDADFVVSRGFDGGAVSLYGDLIWDFTAYQSSGRKKTFNFNFWSKKNIGKRRSLLVSQAKFVIFNLIWMRTGRPLSIGTLYNYFSVLSAMSMYANKNKITLFTLLQDEFALLGFTREGCSGWMRETLGSLLGLFANKRGTYFGFDVVGDEFIKRLKIENREYRATIMQHPPMPTRVYSRFLNGLVEEIDEWENVESDILAVVKFCASDPRAGRSIYVQKAVIRSRGLDKSILQTFEEFASIDCCAYFKKHGFSLDVAGLVSAISRMQYICKLTLQAYTGMRDEEATTLPFHCDSSKKERGVLHLFISGRTTKFSGGKLKRATWVTNAEGYQAVKVAQRIAKTIYVINNARPSLTISKANKYPLFISVVNLSLKGAVKPEDGRFLPGLLNSHPLPKSCESLIAEDDLLELENIDPHRSWRTEDRFKVGQPWYFTSHQTRRSLALYAQRSGLVSLPSLRRQLKHITDEMCRYYSRGSAFARNFIGDFKDHFGVDWQSTQAESSGLSYLINVISKNDEIFGGHGAWVKQQIDKGRISIFDRSETLKKFSRGELFYRETMLGGCVSSDRCERVAVRWLHTPCIEDNCKNFIGCPGKLDRAIDAQSNLLSSLCKNSVEHSTESAALDALIGARQKLRGKSSNE